MEKKLKSVFISFYESVGDLVTKTITLKSENIAKALVEFSEKHEQEPVLIHTEDYIKRA